MSGTHYRPWGPLPWLLGRLPDRRWGVMGSLSTEDRCAAVLTGINRQDRAGLRFVKILDPDQPIDQPFEARHEEMRKRLVTLGCCNGEIVDAELLATIDEMKAEVDAFVAVAGENVILDITSMPKHWFFPIVRALLRDPAVKTMLITYCSAGSYGKQLSSNPNPMRTLPGFGTADSRTSHEVAVVGIGFEPMGLKELYARHRWEKMRYIFPFPPGPPGFHRNWNFVRTLEEQAKEHDDSPEQDRWHINMYDCSSTFDALSRVTRDGQAKAVFAPYGPKTSSLAMCLFACATQEGSGPQLPVYYAQPRRYDIGYSRDVRKTADGRDDIKAYCVKLNGVGLYRLPKLTIGPAN